MLASRLMERLDNDGIRDRADRHVLKHGHPPVKVSIRESRVERDPQSDSEIAEQSGVSD